MSRALLLTSVCVLGALGAACGSSAPDTSAGPFRVGTVGETFFDASRATPATATTPARHGRKLAVLVFYPARGAPGPAGSGTEQNAAPDREDGPYPLIVFAHGFGGSAQGYASLLEQWASAGYVVAAPNFPLTSDETPGGPDLADYVNQPGDMSFVITELLKLSSRSSGALSGLVDPHHIGAAGHSLGGVTTLGLVANSCCRDPRVLAAVVMSGDPLTFPSGHPEFGQAPPLLLVHGNADQAVPYAASVEAFNEARAPKGLLTIEGGDHDSTAIPGDIAFETVVRSTTDFFNLYLKGEESALGRLEAAARTNATRLTFVSKPGSRLTLPVPTTAQGTLRAQVSPSTGLSDGETVTVTWEGYSPGISVNVLECSKSPPQSANDCDLTSAELLQPDPLGAGSLGFVVHTGGVGSGICDAAHPGCVIVVNEGGSSASTSSQIIPISFAP